MRKHLSIILLGVALVFLVSGCVTFTKWYQDYSTVDMYLNDGTRVPTNIPNGAKEWLDNDEAYFFVLFGQHDICAIRYWVAGNDLFCDQWTEYYTGKDILIVVWDLEGEFIKGWIYNNQAIPIRAKEEVIIKLLHEITTPKPKGTDV